MLDLADFDVLTFDCYGTLIDWESGIVDALGRAGVSGEPDALLEQFARHEADLEAGPYRRYREVLAEAARRMGASEDAAVTFGGSVADWPAFADSAAALARLKERFRLGVITNCDDDLFAASNAKLGVEFDWVVTAEQAGGYKPGLKGFELALERIDVPRERILHVAQSLFHDHVPAKALGLTTVWIDRRHDRGGFGATPPAEATPDARFPSMAAFAA
jgi:2-haloacid dehalogenase